MTDVLGLHDRARSVRRSASHSVIGRARLDPVYESASGRVIRVLAPGGFGKSTLVARWIDDDPRCIFWIDIEPIDNDPAVLAAALSRSMRDLNPSGFESIPVAAAGSRSFRDWVVPALGAAVRDCTEPFVLVLDDIHEINHPDADDVVCAVAKNLPPHSTLVLAGRSHRVDRSIARLRLEPGVVDVTASDLALDRAESRELLRSMGIEPRAEFDDFIDRFEGWPAGLRLAGSLMLTTDGASTRSALELGDATHVTDYLRAEWTSSVDPIDLSLLRDAACLGPFTADMCDEVLERSGSGAVLRRLEREEQLVLPLDVRGEWFRMHPLLADWLDADLRSSDRQHWIEVHTAAAAWCECHGDIDRAIEHASLVGDVDRCEQLVVEHAAIRFPTGAHDTVRRWLSRLPDERIRESPALAALASVAAAQRGDGAAALRWERRLTHLVGPDEPVDDDPLSAMAATLRASFEERSSRSQIAAIGRVRRHLPDGPWTHLADWVLGGHLFMIGDERTLDAWSDGALGAELIGASMVAANCLAGAAIVHDFNGDRNRSAEFGAHAQQLLRSVDATHIPTAAVALAVSSLDEARRGRRDVALTELAIARGHLEGFAPIGPWFNVLARLPLVQSALLNDDRPTARLLLRETERFAARSDDASGVEPHLAALWAQVNAVSPMTADGSGALTPTERKVLAYLPTNLTLSEIASALFVSRNTVKSHITAIYRKFGTTSRNEAVALARQAGLIDDVSPNP